MDPLYWPAFCGQRTIYDAFWSNELTVNASSPDLTQCFQLTTLVWTPLVWLILSIPLYISGVFVEPENKEFTCRSKPAKLRLVLQLLLIGVSLLDLIWCFIEQFDKNHDTIVLPVNYVAAILRAATFGALVWVESWSARRGIHSPGIVFVFWLMSLAFGIISLRSQVIQMQQGYPVDIVSFVTFCLYFVLVCLSLVTCLFPGKWSRPEVLTGESQPLLHTEPEVTAETEPTEELCPKLRVSFLSVLFFNWFTKKIYLGYKKTLTMDDMWRLRREDSCGEIVPAFEKQWHKELQKLSPQKSTYGANISSYGGKTDKTDAKESLLSSHGQRIKDEGTRGEKTGSPSLVWALVRTFGRLTVSSGMLLMGYYILSLVNPQILQLLIDFVEQGDPHVWRGYLYAVAMFTCSIVSVFFMHHAMNLNYTLGMHVRTALTSAIYKKAMRLSAVSKKNSTVGEIVNLMSVDTQKLQDAPMFVNYIWGSPIMVALALYFLWQQLGPASLTGLAFMFVVLPVNSTFMAMAIRVLQKKQMQLKDRRIKLMNQVLGGVKVLKLYAWEPFFEKTLVDIRDQELVNMKKGALLSAFTYIVWFCSPFLVALLCFATYVLSDPRNVLDAQTAFVSMSLINLMNFPLTILPVSIMYLVQAMVSLKRITKFLQADEIDPDNVQHEPPSNDEVITVRDGTFSWGEEDRIPLSNINLSIRQGQLVAVVGQVGSGKSSLLSALLGETVKVEGRVNLWGSLSYMSQQSWIQNMTLKDNILFDRPLDEAKYKQVLEVCSLNPDLEILPSGDLTEIGERGINLSGGQKARVSLGRAVYQDSDIYLLDDPLSAVDIHVGRHIFDKIIGPSGVLKDKTRVLITNQLQYLPWVDQIVVLHDGKVSEKGTYQELLSHDGAFAEFVRCYLKEEGLDTDDEDGLLSREDLRKLKQQVSKLGSKSEGEESQGSRSQHSGSKRQSGGGSKRRSGTHKRLKSVRSKEGGESGKDKQLKAGPTTKNVLIKDEIMEEGNVKFSVLKTYIQSASYGFSLLALCALGLFIAAQVSTNIWLSVWSADQPVNGTTDRELVNLRLGVYGALGLAQTLSVLCLGVGIALGGISASRKLHHNLLSHILKCPMSFFDTTPLGRIVNRFSKDIDTVDVNIPQFSQNLMTTLAPLLSTFIMIIYSTPIFVVVFIPLAIIFVVLQRIYVRCARQLKRLDAIKRSPIYAFFSESMNGVSSIRAYQQQNRFISHLQQLLDNSQRVWFEVFTSNRWVGVFAEMLGDLVVLFTAIFSVLQRDTLDPALVGLSLSFALQVSLNLVMTVRSSCELETYIVAVERIKEYTELPTEDAWYKPEKRPLRSWPEHGTVAFQRYSTRYRPELPLVLDDISFDIKQGEKIGIVGRTGAGKSSMTLALFRLIEAATGHIDIDRENISELGLHDLRSKLTIIPQDPVMFSGTVRFNVDPAEFHSDEEIWTALQHAHLKEFIQGLSGGLMYECGEDGTNLSDGQRQLVCLTRALLRKSKVLVLDEATASVDLETDDLIQQSIRSEFKECTVITIAHRLNTIMDYDRVLVMSEGHVKEFDSPTTLVGNKQGLFYAMAKDAGLTS